ncbi:hypothetical protein D3C79_960550 [compost metagenome]
MVELTITRFASLPNTDFTAWVSAVSPAGVEVPCALIYPICDVVTPASSKAFSIASAAPAPFSGGDVM